MDRNAPNIIQIVVDDMGVGDMSAFNKHRSQTYRLDALMEEGVSCAQQYSSSCVCMPARATLMTGRYPQRVGTCDHPHHRPFEYHDPEALTIAEHLASAGYRTAAIGKWHIGTGPCHPARRGFHETVTFQGSMMDYWNWNLEINGVYQKRPDGRYLTDVLTDEALSFICRNRKQPFFLHLAYNAPHTPYQAHESDVKVFRDAGLFNESVCTLYAMLRSVDRGVEQILECLDKLGLRENTLVWFTSDNGAVQNERMRRSNCNMRGGKCTVWEGGIRVPSIVHWPAGGLAGGRVCDDLVHFADWMPTLCNAAGAPLPDDADVDGADIMEALRGNSRYESPVRFWQWTHYGVQPMHNAAVRDGKYKLVSPACGGFVINTVGRDLFGLDLQMLCNVDDVEKSGVDLPSGFKNHREYRDYLLEGAQAPKPDVPFYDPLPAQLFDLEQDPGETKDLSEAKPDVTRKLKRELENWFERIMPEAERHAQANPY
ncbi:MAG: sulfatase-like hydrolase/transferase, partial [Candidatus Sumerlaeia bacterium]